MKSWCIFFEIISIYKMKTKYIECTLVSDRSYVTLKLRRFIGAYGA